jgi:YD repeat-containing protein
MSRRRLIFRVAVGGLLVAVALFGLTLFVGPIVFRAVAQSSRLEGARRTRPLPPGYRPLHKGHIDTTTGLYVREDEDLVLRGTPSFVLRRTYRTRDSRSRAFGVGGSHTGDWYLVGDGDTFQWIDLILEDGGRIHYERVSSGTTIAGARFEHSTTPSEFYGSTLAWSGTDWVVREADGTVLTFRACGSQSLCGITSRREPDGQTIVFRRDATGQLLRIETAAQWIALEYGEGRRIARATDHAGRVVTYTYDERGRLRQSLDADGTKRTYDYDERDRLIRVVEPGRVVENRYDAADMCVWQRARFPADPSRGQAEEETYVFQFAYVRENGRVRQTETRESNAPSHRRVFTVHGSLESETYDFDSDRARTITYEREPSTGLVSGLTLKCAGGRWQSSRTLPANPATEWQVKRELLATPCRPAANRPGL